jgi:small conductance mechanosensitive channel
MQIVTPPPIRNPWDLIVAKFHSVSNDMPRQVSGILGGILFVVVPGLGRGRWKHDA